MAIPVMTWPTCAWTSRRWTTIPGGFRRGTTSVRAMTARETLADAFLRAYEQASGRTIPNLAFWELAAAARFMPDPAGLIAEWQSLQAGAYSDTAVRQNFSNFIASALWRAGLEK